jgi:hypothetical protein
MLERDLTPFTINLKGNIDLNVKHKAIRLLEENIGVGDLGSGHEFLDTT